MPKKSLMPIARLTAYFDELEDPRVERSQRHKLIDIIVCAVCAIIGGAEGPSDMNTWARINEDWLKTFLELPGGAPSRDTFRRVLSKIDGQVFQRCFLEWLNDSMDTCPPLSKWKGRTIALDGKTLRRSGEPLQNKSPLHIVSAWCSEHSLTLGQVATEEKSNEITAIPELLGQIEIKGDTVTIDAMGCQKKIAKKILAKKADYALAVKGNQKKLHNQIVGYFTQAVGERTVNADVRQHVAADHGHGRDDVRYHYVAALTGDMDACTCWPGAKAIGMVIRESEDKHGNRTSDRRYYLLSRFVGAERLAHMVRSHWGIENACHWVLDVVFNEDQHRTRERTLAANISFLKRFAIGVLKKHPDKKTSIKQKRKMAGWSNQFLLEALGFEGA